MQADRIDPGLWEVTVQTLMRRFADSADLKLAVDIYEAFLASRPDKLLFLSEWEAFLLSLDFSDLLKEDLEAVFVTTIHKAKGREFEQVHMVWPDAAAPKEADWNVMYVGMTRAKMELHIHTCNPVFDRLYWQASEVLVHPGRVESFREIEFQCGLKDIFLSRFQSNEVNKACKGLMAGQRLAPHGLEGIRLTGVGVVAFSQDFQEKLRAWAGKGYVMDEMTISHIVYWRNDDMPAQVPVILPRMRMRKPLWFVAAPLSR